MTKEPHLKFFKSIIEDRKVKVGVVDGEGGNLAIIQTRMVNMKFYLNFFCRFSGTKQPNLKE